MTFADALHEAFNGNTISRSGWNGKGQWVGVQYPDSNSKMDEPYLYLCNTSGKLVPWVPSQGDLFAGDWDICR